MLSQLTYTLPLFLALADFAFVSSITPGPNNLMLLHSGIRFGFRPTIPHLLGISFGAGLMVLLCCFGVAAMILSVPAASWALKIIGCAYMLWLTYKLWQNGALPANGELPAAGNQNAAKPFTFMQAALFQYVNPKAWMMGLMIPASFLPKDGSLLSNALFVVVVFVVINLLCVSVWAQGGATLQKILHKPKLAQAINTIIVLMTLLCALSVWL